MYLRLNAIGVLCITVPPYCAHGHEIGAPMELIHT